MSGPTVPAVSGSRASHAPPIHPPFLRRSTGISGLGPIRERPYHPAYAPVQWRGWLDFGTGALGDMGCHIIDHPVWALKLGAPTFVEARTTLDGSFFDGDKPNVETYPIAALIYFEFPARGDLPPVRMTWYDGGLMPASPRRASLGRAPSGQWSPLRRQQRKNVPQLPRRHAPASSDRAP